MRTRPNGGNPATRNPKLPQVEFEYCAQVINWWTVTGLGHTPEEAVRALSAAFELRKQNIDSLPRPGTRVPLRFASDSIVRAHDTLARDFFMRILGVEKDKFYISDSSSLEDCIWPDGDLRPTFDKIRQVYGVDVSDVPNATIAQILVKLDQAGAKPAEGPGASETK